MLPCGSGAKLLPHVVAVLGRTTNDERGSGVLLTTSCHRHSRPGVPDGLRWLTERRAIRLSRGGLATGAEAHDVRC